MLFKNREKNKKKKNKRIYFLDKICPTVLQVNKQNIFLKEIRETICEKWVGFLKERWRA